MQRALERSGVLVLFTVAMLLPGCTPFAPGNNRTVEPRFVLDARPTVVFVEPMSDDPEDARFARQAAARATVQLEDNPEHIVALMIDPAVVVDLQQQDAEAFKTKSIDAIGRDAGAEVVIYARVTDAALNGQDVLFRPTAAARVRVIDALTGQRLFPESGGAAVSGRAPAFPLSVGGSYFADDSARDSRTAQARAWHALADETGLALARLFYPWQNQAPGERIAQEKARYQRSNR